MACDRHSVRNRFHLSVQGRRILRNYTATPAAFWKVIAVIAAVGNSQTPVIVRTSARDPGAAGGIQTSDRQNHRRTKSVVGPSLTTSAKASDSLATFPSLLDPETKLIAAMPAAPARNISTFSSVMPPSASTGNGCTAKRLMQIADPTGSTVNPFGFVSNTGP